MLVSESFILPSQTCCFLFFAGSRLSRDAIPAVSDIDWHSYCCPTRNNSHWNGTRSRSEDDISQGPGAGTVMIGFCNNHLSELVYH